MYLGKGSWGNGLRLHSTSEVATGGKGILGGHSGIVNRTTEGNFLVLQTDRLIDGAIFLYHLLFYCDETPGPRTKIIIVRKSLLGLTVPRRLRVHVRKWKQKYYVPNP